MLDATTAAEDRTFWDNAGIDVPALISAAAENASGTGERGASTITQQLVRARLLPDDVIEAGADRYVRKVKEIIQSLRLSDEYPGEAGKQRVVTAYLNEIFYGHGAYGIAAAAEIYFGVSDLSTLTVAQAALLAGLPKAPTTLDPYRFAVPDAKGRLVVPAGSAPVVRRDWVLEGIAATGRWTTLETDELRAATEEPIVLAGERPVRIPGGHFTWQVRRQLEAILGPDADLERGGYRVTTTLDWRAQRLAEKWLAATAIAPNVSRRAAERMLNRTRIPKGERAWIRRAPRQGPAQRGARRARLPHRRRPCLRRQRGLRPRRSGEPSLRAEIRRGRRRCPATGFRLEARSSTRPRSTRSG